MHWGLTYGSTPATLLLQLRLLRHGDLDPQPSVIHRVLQLASGPLELKNISIRGNADKPLGGGSRMAGRLEGSTRAARKIRII